jgi:hypothetical protein
LVALPVVGEVIAGAAGMAVSTFRAIAVEDELVLFAASVAVEVIVLAPSASELVAASDQAPEPFAVVVPTLTPLL